MAGVAHHAGTKSAQAQANEQAQNQQLAELEAQNAAMQQQMAVAAARGGRASGRSGRRLPPLRRAISLPSWNSSRRSIRPAC